MSYFPDSNKNLLNTTAIKFKQYVTLIPCFLATPTLLKTFSDKIIIFNALVFILKKNPSKTFPYYKMLPIRDHIARTVKKLSAFMSRQASNFTNSTP